MKLIELRNQTTEAIIDQMLNDMWDVGFFENQARSSFNKSAKRDFKRIVNLNRARVSKCLKVLVERNVIDKSAEFRIDGCMFKNGRIESRWWLNDRNTKTVNTETFRTRSR